MNFNCRYSSLSICDCHRWRRGANRVIRQDAIDNTWFRLPGNIQFNSVHISLHYLLVRTRYIPYISQYKSILLFRFSWVSGRQFTFATPLKACIQVILIMAILTFTLNPDALGKFHDALVCLGKFSETVSIEATHSRVGLDIWLLYIVANTVYSLSWRRSIQQSPLMLPLHWWEISSSLSINIRHCAMVAKRRKSLAARFTTKYAFISYNIKILVNCSIGSTRGF